ncbi:MAG: methyl-accepting chemotaxis protein, partial [Acetatifactor sp.]|nr:methyl-accepting chemotaxis protein [Acetatifactor sp.]
IKETVEAVNIAVEECAKGVVNVTTVSTDLTQSMGNINDEANGNKEVADRLEAEVGKFKL